MTINPDALENIAHANEMVRAPDEHFHHDKGADTMCALVADHTRLLRESAATEERTLQLETGVYLALLTFRRYEKEHTEKGTVEGDEKAARNKFEADRLEALISTDGADIEPREH